MSMRRSSSLISISVSSSTSGSTSTSAKAVWRRWAGVERREAHQPVRRPLSLLDVAVGVVAADLDRGALDPRLLALGHVEHFGLEAAPLGPAQVHAQQHLGPVLGSMPPAPAWTPRMTSWPSYGPESIEPSSSCVDLALEAGRPRAPTSATSPRRPPRASSSNSAVSSTWAVRRRHSPTSWRRPPSRFISSCAVRASFQNPGRRSASLKPRSRALPGKSKTHPESGRGAAGRRRDRWSAR